MSNAVYWFSNDLRLSDNLAVTQALLHEPRVSFIYCLDPRVLKPNQYLSQPLGEFRLRFLIESLISVNERLQQFGQYLNVYYQSPITLLEYLHLNRGVNRIYHSVNSGFDEQKIVNKLKKMLPTLKFQAWDTHTLFARGELPCALSALPETCSKFRKIIEKNDLQVPRPVDLPLDYGKPALPAEPWGIPKIIDKPRLGYKFEGGERAGLAHLKSYFYSDAPQRYKRTRNALDGKKNSTKFSPWLAMGCISARQVMSCLRQHEARQGANDSTSWIFFELIWREYFQWYAHKHQQRLFSFTGIRSRAPLTSFYDERFQRWCTGNTPYPIVNACMHELNATGYMSNRGRQLVASCFLHELSLDWRYGAAYFEQQLIDYDVASNWGNWQYLAGVGADPRGSRRFNLSKQTAMYDPDGQYIRQWQGQQSSVLDSVDAVGWPMDPSSGGE